MTQAVRNNPDRFSRLDWPQALRGLEARGHAYLPDVLTASECGDLTRLSGPDGTFGKSVGNTGAGGTYGHFFRAPDRIAALRRALYENTVDLANTWLAAATKATRAPFGVDSYPAKFDDFVSFCKRGGQALEACQLTHYADGGFREPRQDLHGGIAYPFRMSVMLSNPPADFEGGSIVLTEPDRRPPEPGALFTRSPETGATGRSEMRTYHNLPQGGALIFPSIVRIEPDSGEVLAVTQGVDPVLAPAPARGRMTLEIVPHGRNR
jgi:hypothetical protein